jgi:transcriptional regulator with XRE-family HTH domain
MKPKEIKSEHKELMEEIGRRVKKLRTDKSIAYIEMAKAIGLSRNAYHSIELGHVYFNFSSLLLIANYHNISVSALLEGL